MRTGLTTLSRWRHGFESRWGCQSLILDPLLVVQNQRLMRAENGRCDSVAYFGGTMAFHPYLYFGGNCREAFTRYQEIFGGELFLMAMKDAPDMQVQPGQEDLIMHAALMLGDDLLMASDDPTTDKFGPVQGMQVNYSVADVDEAKRAFEALVEGGNVTLPIAPTFFSPMFGMCVDRFGTP